MDNKSGGLSHKDDEDSHVSKAKLMREMTDEDREFVSQIDAEYYKRVRSSDEFYRRKKLILMNLEKLEAKVSHQAVDYDEYQQLKFITMEKARQKKSILRNFVKLEDFKRQQDYDTSYSSSAGK